MTSTEQVSGTAGHVDRQWFPKYAGGGGTGGDPRARSHEWRTINFDNGVDLSIWRQFDRTNGNALQPFTGVDDELSGPAAAPECAEDVEVTVTSYVRWPDSVRPLLRPLVTGPVSCPTATGSAVPHCNSTSSESRWWPRPAHGLPIEYMEGPTAIAGPCGGNR